MSVCMNNFYFSIKLLKSGIVANAKLRKDPGLGMLIACMLFSVGYGRTS